MTIDEVREIVENRLPSELIESVTDLSLQVSVHPPGEGGLYAKALGKDDYAAVIYATDSPGGNPPWKAVKHGLQAIELIGSGDDEGEVVYLVQSLCYAFARHKKYMAVANETSSWEEFQERVPGFNKECYDTLIARKNRSAA